jgi:nucleotide-binding universal stress UspA family protein
VSASSPDQPPVEFRRVVCALDTSPQSVEAARQALEIAAPGADAIGVLAWNPSEAAHAGIHRAEVARDLRARAEEELAAVGERFPQLATRLAEGEEKAQLLAAIADANADLLSVGAHGTGGRMAGVLLGRVSTAMIHAAPCSVLVARERGSGDSTAVIVHAADGSDGSLEAARTAAAIAARTGGSILSVHVGADEQGQAAAEEAAAVAESAGVSATTRLESGAPHARLGEIAGEVGARMVVVGARGVTGLKALGSVSERVAHEAPCSVLIVRR